jgi:hypothetical protein
MTIGLNAHCKGKQLKESEDTNYSRDLAKIFEDIGESVTGQGL